MNILLTGGAGYIGSHLVRALKRVGHRPVVYDSLVSGHRQAIADADFVAADVADDEALRAAMRQYDIEAVIHLAAFIEAGESVEKPEKYFGNNTAIGLSLLEAMREVGVAKMVFSSTAAVYGLPERVPIVETDRLDPINPYGSSKLCVEYMLRAYAKAYDMGCMSLRYFNVAGADPAGGVGEDHRPETHLIPLTLQVAAGMRKNIQIFGGDYDTPDGTCIRDYVHVCDLAEAHILALGAIERGAVKVYNLGSGDGFSVKQVVDVCRNVTGHAVPAEVQGRRAGDPARLVASAEKAFKELGWRPRYPGLEQMVAHAWAWHRSNPRGYG